MNKRTRRTVSAIFATPVTVDIRWADVEAMVVGLGGAVRQREGSRVAFILSGQVMVFHRPHPGNEARPYQVRELRRMLELIGIKPEDGR